LKQIRESLKQAAIEVGDWGQKQQVNAPDIPDLSQLTTEQLYEEGRILQEVRDRVEALRSIGVDRSRHGRVGTGRTRRHFPHPSARIPGG
jgi:hypothetical protein